MRTSSPNDREGCFGSTTVLRNFASLSSRMKASMSAPGKVVEADRRVETGVPMVETEPTSDRSSTGRAGRGDGRGSALDTGMRTGGGGGAEGGAGVGTRERTDWGAESVSKWTRF